MDANSFRVEGKAVKYILSRISGDFRFRSTLWFDIRSSSFTLVVFFSVLKIESPLVEYRWQVNHLYSKKKVCFRAVCDEGTLKRLSHFGHFE